MVVNCSGCGADFDRPVGVPGRPRKQCFRCSPSKEREPDPEAPSAAQVRRHLAIWRGRKEMLRRQRQAECERPGLDPLRGRAVAVACEEDEED